MASEHSEHRQAAATGPSPMHALIIEDFPVIAMSIEDELADMGYSAAIAATEVEALALVGERCPDLIIADVRLAQGCGIEAVRRICGDRAVSVIFMSGDVDAVADSVTGKAGFLCKPFTSAALRSTIETAGSMSRA